jgi:hypothetical protein
MLLEVENPKVSHVISYLLHLDVLSQPLNVCQGGILR